MRPFLFSVLLSLFFSNLDAQHCPWDCSGIMLLEWPKGKKSSDYTITLVDKECNPVKEVNVYGTENSYFMLYEYWRSMRVQDIPKYNHYKYDTAYHFAEGSLVAFFNFCQYGGKEMLVKLELRNDPGNMIYIPVQQEAKIHLHNTEIWKNKTATGFDPKYKVKIVL